MQESPGMSTKFKILNLAAADFIVRTAYQMGKTPLLPLFAAGLGANATFLGFIVSASTLTGMLFKPLFGMLSDRWGRWIWFFIGTVLFSIVPFLYLWIENVHQLFMLRLLHGTATAIYGPVTVACWITGICGLHGLVFCKSIFTSLRAAAEHPCIMGWPIFHDPGINSPCSEAFWRSFE